MSGEREDAAARTHETSKIRRSGEHVWRWVWFATADEPPPEIPARPSKSYPGKPRVALPDAVADLPPAVDGFDDVVLQRRSARAFDGPVPLASLAKMLRFGYGLTRGTFRASPSAGALYPLELYVAAFSIEGLAPALYHYAPPENALELLSEGNHYQRLADTLTTPSDILGGAAGAVIITAVFERSEFKYGKRAYRFVLLEAGHVCQNLMLAACSLGLATVPIGGFFDDEVNELVGIDGSAEAALYILPFGLPLLPSAGGEGAAGG